MDGKPEMYYRCLLPLTGLEDLHALPLFDQLQNKHFAAMLQRGKVFVDDSWFLGAAPLALEDGAVEALPMEDEEHLDTEDALHPLAAPDDAGWPWLFGRMAAARPRLCRQRGPQGLSSR